MKSLNKAVQAYINAVESHIDAGHNLSDAMQTLLPLYNKAQLSDQVEIRNSVAYLIGTKKGVVPKLMTQGINKGCMGFDAHGSKAEQQARDMLRYYLPVKTVGNTPTPKKATKPNPVTKLLKEFKALTPAQRKAFLAEVL